MITVLSQQTSVRIEEQFLPRDTMLARYMPWPSVCLSVTSRCFTKTLEVG